MKIRKKLLTALLVLVMVAGVLPISAFAEGDNPPAATEFAAENPDYNEEDTTEETGAPSDPGELPEKDQEKEPSGNSGDFLEEDGGKEPGNNGGDQKIKAKSNPDDEERKTQAPEPATTEVPELTPAPTPKQSNAAAKKAAPALKGGDPMLPGHGDNNDHDQPPAEKETTYIKLTTAPKRDYCFLDEKYEATFELVGSASGQTDKISITLDGKGEAFDYDMGTRQYSLILNNPLHPLATGEHTLEIAFAGTDTLAPCTKSFVFDVGDRENPIPTEITFTALLGQMSLLPGVPWEPTESLEVYQGYELVFTLTEKGHPDRPLAGKTVYVADNANLDGTFLTDSEGKISIDDIYYTSGEKSVVVQFPSGSVYEGCEARTSFPVTKIKTGLTIQTDKEEYSPGEDVTISGRLTQNSMYVGTPHSDGSIVSDELKGMTVSLLINDEPLQTASPIESDENGDFSYTFKAGTTGSYSVKALFAQDEVYHGCSAETAFAVGDAVYAIFNSTDGSLTFKREAGTYTDGQEVGTLTYYTVDEDFEYTAGERPSWLAKAKGIKKVDFQTVVAPKSCVCWFDYCENLEEVINADRLKTSRVTSMRLMFNDCSKLASIDTSKWNTSKVDDMGSMFNGCTSLASLDVSEWNTSGVRDMGSMFSSCSELASLDVSKWNTSKVADMGGMFSGCSELATLDVSGWDTSKVEDIAGMFGSCSSLASLDVSGWDTSKVTGMGSMFNFCSSLTSLNVSGWDTSKVESMAYMFNNCTSLASLDVSGWDTSNVIMMNGMFYNCSKLDFLDLSGWDTSNAENMHNMFEGCTSLSSVRLGENFSFKGGVGNPGWYAVLPNAPAELGHNGKWINESTTGASGVTPADLRDNYPNESDPDYGIGTYVWEGTTKVAVFDSKEGSLTFKREAGMYDNGDTDGTKTYYTGFEDKEYSERVKPSWLDHKDDIEKVEFQVTVAPISCACWFEGCESLAEVLGADKLTTSGVTNMEWMFNDCRKLVALDASGWNTSKVVTMNHMFNGCQSLSHLDVSGWDTSKVKKMSAMFGGCLNLANLDVSGWDTSQVADMRYMFQACEKLASLDLSGWDTLKVMDMGSMFSGCSELAFLDLSGWNTSNVMTMRHMFFECTSLSSVKLGKDFSFVYAVLPDAPESLGHGGRWINESVPGATGVTAADLRDNYPNAADPGFAPGTYMWEAHKMTRHDAVAPTCTEDGNIEYYACERCSKNFSDEEGTVVLDDIVDPMTGHKMTHHEEVPATCTKDGTLEYWACGNCHKNFGDEEGTDELDSLVDPKTGHAYGQWEKLDDAQHQRVCSHDSSHVEKEDHKWDDGKARTTGAGSVTIFTCTVCKATKEVENKGKTYQLSSGANGSWTKGSTASLKFTFKNTEDDSETFDHFAGIKVDGKDIPEKDASGKANWTKQKGSVIIELQPSYLETLSVGKHKLTASFDDGADVTGEFAVKAKAETPTVTSTKTPTKTPTKAATTSGKATTTAPKTGDESNMLLWFMLIGASLFVMFLIISLRNRRYYDR